MSLDGFFFFAGVQTQDLVHVREALYHWPTPLVLRLILI
jgi:hypothetical protein